MTSPASLHFSIRRCFRRIALGCFATAVISPHAQNAVPPYAFRHLAGTLGGPGKVDGNGISARFSYATGVAADQSGNVYLTDSHAETIRKITPDGTVTTIAGMPMVAGSQDGTGQDARFNFPTGPAIDASGNLFVADWANNTIRKITPAGVVTTIAGSALGADGPGYVGNSNDGVGTAARFFGPSSVAVDGAGNLFVADSGNEKIRKITPDGTVTTLNLSGAADWPLNLFGDDPNFSRVWGSAFTYGYPSQISIDHAGNSYCARYEWMPNSAGVPSDYLLLKIDPSGVVSTLPQFPATTSLAGPAVDKFDRLFVGTPAGLLHMDPSGTITAVTGSPVDNGAGLTVTASGDCIVADFDQILKISPAGNVRIFTGLTATPGSADGTGAAAGFCCPEGLAVDANGTVWVADTGNATIRKISPGGVVTTLAGKAGAIGTADGLGAAAQFSVPSRVVLDGSGNLYVSDGAIRKITADGTVRTLADVPVETPRHVRAVDAAGNLYFLEETSDPTSFSWSSQIKKLTPDGVLTTVASIPGGGVADFVLDQTGDIYATKATQIIKIDPLGNITTLAGPGANGPGANAQFTKLGALAIDRTSNIYVVDRNSICRIAPDGTTVTLGGSVTSPGSDDGLGSEALFNAPGALAVDPAGNIYVADTNNHSIRIGAPVGPPVITTQPLSQTTAPGGTVQFSVVASGVPAPTYQWYLNGVAYNGATTSTLSFSTTRSSDAGDYSVVVTNAEGSVTSNKATLTVSSASPAPPASSSSATGGGGGGTSSALARIF